MATLKQLQRFDLGDGNGRFNSNTELHQRIQEFIPRNQIDFATSKQQQVGFHLTFWNNLQWILILISLVVLMIIWVFRGGGLVRQHTLFIVLFIMINAMVAGAFANVIDRLGCKVMWMIPFALSIHIIRYTFQLKTRQIHPRG